MFSTFLLLIIFVLYRIFVLCIPPNCQDPLILCVPDNYTFSTAFSSISSGSQIYVKGGYYLIDSFNALITTKGISLSSRNSFTAYDYEKVFLEISQSNTMPLFQLEVSNWEFGSELGEMVVMNNADGEVIKIKTVNAHSENVENVTIRNIEFHEKSSYYGGVIGIMESTSSYRIDNIVIEKNKFYDMNQEGDGNWFHSIWAEQWRNKNPSSISNSNEYQRLRVRENEFRNMSHSVMGGRYYYSTFERNLYQSSSLNSEFMDLMVVDASGNILFYNNIFDLITPARMIMGGATDEPSVFIGNNLFHCKSIQDAPIYVADASGITFANPWNITNNMFKGFCNSSVFLTNIDGDWDNTYDAPIYFKNNIIESNTFRSFSSCYDEGISEYVDCSDDTVFIEIDNVVSGSIDLYERLTFPTPFLKPIKNYYGRFYPFPESPLLDYEENVRDLDYYMKGPYNSIPICDGSFFDIEERCELCIDGFIKNVTGLCVCADSLKDLKTQCQTCVQNYVKNATGDCVCYRPFLDFANGCETCIENFKKNATDHCICSDPLKDITNDCETCINLYSKNATGDCVCYRPYLDFANGCETCIENFKKNATDHCICSDPLKDITNDCETCIALYSKNATGNCVCYRPYLDFANGCETCIENFKKNATDHCICSDPLKDITNDCETCIALYSKNATGNCVCYRPYLDFANGCETCIENFKKNATDHCICSDPLKDITNGCETCIDLYSKNSTGNCVCYRPFLDFANGCETCIEDYEKNATGYCELKKNHKLDDDDDDDDDEFFGGMTQDDLLFYGIGN